MLFVMTRASIRRWIVSFQVSELDREIRIQLGQRHKELLDDIMSDLKGCLYSRAVLGRNNSFFEHVLMIYQNGGWPCGWKGDWPNGQAIAYYVA
jgi:hypothetical protein